MKVQTEKIDSTKQQPKQKKPNADQWVLKLYVADQTPRSLNAIRNLEAICEEKLQGKYEIVVIDLLLNPELSIDDQIIALPTLVRRVPGPIRKIIGDLSNTERVLLGLDLLPNNKF